MLFMKGGGDNLLFGLLGYGWEGRGLPNIWGIGGRGVT